MVGFYLNFIVEIPSIIYSTKIPVILTGFSIMARAPLIGEIGEPSQPLKK
jgi:hypothetical protein